jgi:hypothetical protein
VSPFQYLVFLVLLLHYRNASCAETSQCTLFLAPSSTLDDEENDQFQLGIYAGVDVHPGNVIGAPEVAVPLIDLDLHNGEHRAEEYLQDFANFMWTPETIHANFEIFPVTHGGSHINVAIPGIGALTNQHFTSYANSELQDSVVLDRLPMFESADVGVSPSRGANSQYYGVTLKSKSFIPVGMEILMSGLGAEVEDSGFDAEVIDYFDNSIADIHRFLKKYEKDMTDEKSIEIYKYLNEVVQTSTRRSLDEKDRNQEEITEIIELFPKNPKDIDNYLQEGGAFVARFPEMRKSLDWLLENGQCLDGLYPGKSSIPNAEKGAFARRAFKEGDLITPSPLFMIRHEHILDMYPLEVKGNGTEQYTELKLPRHDPVSKQLLLNYCFGHPESSLLFYPYGMGVNLINHLSTGKGSNAKVVWSRAPFYDNDLLKLSAKDLAQNYGAVLPLGLDVVATRDIAADEEVFIDYGEVWQQAWDDHVKAWDSSKKWPKEALELNAERGKEPFMTLSEMQGSGNPMPDNIMTACHAIGYKDSETSDKKPTVQFDEKNTKLTGDQFKMCDVLERHEKSEVVDSGYLYTVQMHQVDADDIIIANVPHSHIRYVDKPYQSSMHKESFRHPIQIPDEMFPPSWRDKK